MARVSTACLQSGGVEAGPAEVCLVYFYLETLPLRPLSSLPLAPGGSLKQVAIPLSVHLAGCASS